jgi:hypothetical protein
MRAYLLFKPLPGYQLVHRFQKRLPLALGVFHVRREGLLLFHEKSISEFFDLISVTLDERSNAITAMPKLLDLLDIQEGTVTIDAED